MLNFLKKLFAKEELQEEKVELNELNNWLDSKTKPKIENLNNNIDQITNKNDQYSYYYGLKTK